MSVGRLRLNSARGPADESSQPSATLMITRLRRLLLFSTGAVTPIESAVLFNIGPIPLSMSKLITALLLALVLVQWVVERRRFVRNSKNPWVVAFAASCFIGFAVSTAKDLPVY